MVSFRKISDTEFRVGMYMWCNYPATFKSITFKFIYEDKTLSIIFSQLGDSLTVYTFNSGTDGNTILNKIITDIQPKGNVSIKLVIDIVW